jgi:hypothetical protein
MYHVVIQILCNAIATLVFAAFLLLVAKEARATHCPGCDTTEPSYGSSAFERRYDAGKYQPGDGRTPYEPRETNTQRDNREQLEREQSQREERSRPYSAPYGQSSNRNGHGHGVR